MLKGRHVMRILYVLITLLASACAYAPVYVPVSGSSAGLTSLEGEWAGENWSDDSPGRHGLIFFRLAATHDSAFGDVVMIVEPVGAGATALDRNTPWVQLARQNQVLAITFVRVEAGTVTGSLDPYPDPICGCTLRTSFEGTVRDGVIEGTYTSRHVQTGKVTSGHWKVARKQS
jgi:hypothetical protein